MTFGVTVRLLGHLVNFVATIVFADLHHASTLVPSSPTPECRQQISSQACLHSGHVSHVTLLLTLADLRSVFHLCLQC